MAAIVQWCASLEDGSLSQYTGITDRAGNKIWEGDIVLRQLDSEWNGKEDISVCYYSTVVSMFGMFGLTDAKGLEKPGSFFSFIIDPHMTPCNMTAQSLDVLVVGNLHQHANLLRLGALAPVVKSSHLTISTHGNRHI